MSRAEITRGKEMAFTKITNVELNSRGATTLPNQPTISASALKQEFDAPAKNIVAPKFNNLIDELEAVTSAASLGAVAPTGRTGTTVQGVLNSLSTDLGNVETSSHTHSNKTVIDKFADDGTGLTYDGSPISGAVDSVNGQTGVVVLDATDVGALPDDTVIPSNTSDLNNDSNFVVDASYVHTDNNYDATAKGIVDGATAAIAAKSTVTWNQQVLTGQKIATISINGTPTDVYAPTGGSPGTGAVDSVNGQTGTVVLDLDDINDTSIASLADQDTLVYNGTAGTWGNEPLADVALTGAYSSLTGQPTIPDGLADLTDDVAISSPSSGQILQHNGTKWANANMPSIPDGLADLTDDVSISSPSNDQVLKYDSSSSKWVNGSAPASGHTMIPIYDSDTGLTDLETIEALNGGTDEKVVNAYSVKRWSNCDAKVVLALASQGDDGIGDWEAEGTWETGSRSGWLWSADLYHVLNDGATPPTTNYEVEVMPVFDGGENETVSLYAFRIDDNVSNGGVNGGAVAFKFNAPIQSANGVRVGVKIINQRTDVTITGTILT